MAVFSVPQLEVEEVEKLLLVLPNPSHLKVKIFQPSFLPLNAQFKDLSLKTINNCETYINNPTKKHIISLVKKEYTSSDYSSSDRITLEEATFRLNGNCTILLNEYDLNINYNNEGFSEELLKIITVASSIKNLELKITKARQY